MSFSVRSRKISEKTDDPFVVNEKELVNEKLDKKGVVYKEEPEWLTALQDKIRVGVLASLSYYLRTMKLGFPNYVTDMELEITSQINWYMSGKFFIGKFPPLFGIISSSLARVVGYYGTEDLYYAGQPFIEFPMVALRRVSAILGTSLVPLSYLTMRNLGHSRSTATMAAALIMMENGLVTQSRYATPEIYVLFFSALATYSWTLVHKYSQESHAIVNTKSGIWQLVTGISLGCALSSKWTGALSMLITWAFVGFEIWNRLCERRTKVKNTMKRLGVYSLTIGLLPLLVYFTIFSFHLDLVSNSGDHDLLLSSKLKYSLIGNELEASQPNIAYGSQIVIRHDGSVGGYLHSHRKRFSGGSTQQEVTLYPYIDINNIWTVHKINKLWNSSDPIEFVKNKDQIRLEHFASTRKLHSHDHRPQMITKKEHNEVTAYGDKMISDSHDYWNLHILNDEGRSEKNTNVTWKSLNQRFRLQHIRGCNLISHENYYAPPEGENHQEVTCMASAGTHISKWIVESSYHEQMEDVEHITYTKMSKFEMLKEIHTAMMNYPKFVYSRLQTSSSNNGAINLRNSGEESPGKWFFKRAALKFWNELSGFSTYLVLNPIVQRLTLFSMSTYLGCLALNAFLWKRQIKLPSYLTWLNTTGLDVIVNEYYTKSVTLFYSAIIIHLGFLRFLPPHVTNMSDILGSMYYGTGLVAVLLEACTVRLPTLWRRIIFYGLLVLALYKFSHLSHLSYGGAMWYRSDCEKSGIDIDCIRFPPHQGDLADIILNSGSTTNSTQLTIYVDLPGHSQPFRYNQGQEVEADAHVAIIKKVAYEKEVQSASGIYRYHRVFPTPGITPEEAALWAREITDAAAIRYTAELKHKQEEEARRQAELDKQAQDATNELQHAVDEAADAAIQHQQENMQQDNNNVKNQYIAIQEAAERLKVKAAAEQVVA